MRTKSRVILARLLLLAVSTGVALIVLEVAIRAIQPFYDPRRQIVFRVTEDGTPLGPVNKTVRQRTPKGDYDLQVSFNRFGFRDSKDMTTSANSDWFVVGDSFGFGWGVEQTNRFSNVLDAAEPFRVFNICIPTDIAGYSKLLSYARQCGATVSNLVVSVCMENDLRDCYLTHTPAPRQQTNKGKERMREYLKSHSAIYRCLSYELQRSERLRVFLENIGIARKVDSDELTPKNAFSREAILYAVSLLDAVVRQSTRSVVLIIPSRALWTGHSRETEAQAHDLFVSEAKKRGMKVVDMKPIFEEGKDPMQYYFRTDPHWNETGHQLAARCLAEQIDYGQQSSGAYSSKAADGLTGNAQK